MGLIHITSGKLRGRNLRTPAGQATRPLLTRVRKSLADIMRPRLPGARILDLFGGSGAIAFELLSNGAARAVVVELDAPTAQLIRANAGTLGVEQDVTVEQGDGIEVIGLLAARGERFDIIIIAPPYGRGLQEKALEAVTAHSILTKQGAVIVQCEQKETVPDTCGGLHRVRARSYGRTVFSFYEQEAP